MCRDGLKETQGPGFLTSNLNGGFASNLSVKGGFLINFPKLSWVCFITAGDAAILKSELEETVHEFSKDL